MSRRRISDEERILFEATIAESRPLKKETAPKARAKPSTLSAGARKPEPSGLDGRIGERLRRGLLEPDRTPGFARHDAGQRRIALCCLSCMALSAAASSLCWS